MPTISVFSKPRAGDPVGTHPFPVAANEPYLGGDGYIGDMTARICWTRTRLSSPSSPNTGDCELSCGICYDIARTRSRIPRSLKSLMNMLPARMGPTVCELLGPTEKPKHRV